MALVSAAKGSQVTVLSTEHSLSQQTGIGIYVLVVDTSAMVAGDTLVVRLKTKYGTGGTSRLAYETTYTGAQNEANKYSVPVPVDTEIIATIAHTVGVAKTYPWNLLRA